MIKVLKRKKHVHGRVKESRYYYLRYRFDWMPVEKWHSLRVTDKQVAEKRAHEFVVEQEREHAGLLDPKPVRDTARQPLSELIATFADDLNTRGRGGRKGRDARLVKNRLLLLCRECGWTYVGQVSVDGFSRWRQQQAFGARTLNHYLEGMVTFLNFLERSGRIPLNPLRHAQKVDGRGRKRRVRRALTDDELRRLMAKAGPRAIIYFVAARTGLRQEELGQLVWGDLSLDPSRPTVRARATTTKNKKEELLPLLPEVARQLQACRPAQATLQTPVFSKGIPRARRLEKDLAAAGIPYQDELGRYADFHALRMTFATFLQRNGVPIHVAKILMRHSDIRMTTQTYLDEHLLPLQEAVNGLPGLFDVNEGSRGESQISGANGHGAANRDLDHDLKNRDQTIENTGESLALAGTVTERPMERVEGIEPS